MELNEKALIGEAVHRPEAVLSACVDSGLMSDQFIHPTAAKAFASIMRVWGQGGKVDGTLVEDERFLSECFALCPVLDLDRCIQNIQNASKNMRLRERLMYEASSIDLNSESDHREILSMVQKSVDEFDLRETDEREFREVAREEAEKIISGQSQEGMIPWPVEMFNERMGKISNELIFISARPGVGKTAWVLLWLILLAKLDIKASLLSLESGLRTLSHRVIGSMSGVNMQRFKNGQFHDGDPAAIRAVTDQLDKINPCIRHGTYTMEKIYSYARAEKKNGLRILMIDNLKHIKATKKYFNRYDQFADFSAQLKWLRDELDIPVVVLHHLNRNLELAMSDDIERDADVVITMTEDEDRSIMPTPENNHQEKSVVKVEVSKARDAARGIIHLEFQKEIQRFVPCR